MNIVCDMHGPSIKMTYMDVIYVLILMSFALYMMDVIYVLILMSFALYMFQSFANFGFNVVILYTYVFCFIYVST